MVGVTQTFRESAQLYTRLGTVEAAVNMMSGSLENFLGRIRIDDDMQIVPARRRLGAATPLDIDFHLWCRAVPHEGCRRQQPLLCQ